MSEFSLEALDMITSSLCSRLDGRHRGQLRAARARGQSAQPGVPHPQVVGRALLRVLVPQRPRRQLLGPRGHQDHHEPGGGQDKVRVTACV